MSTVAGELVIVRCDDQRAAPAGQTPEKIAKLGAPVRVERGGGFIQKQKLRVYGKSASDGNALRFSAGDLPGERPGEMLDAQRNEQVARAALSFLSRYAVRVHRRKPDVLEHGKMFEEMVKLENQADPGTEPLQHGRRRTDASAQDDFRDLYDSRLKCFESGDHPEQRGLARARRAHESDRLALSGVERGAREHSALATKEGDVADAKHRHGIGAFQRRSNCRARAASGNDIAR